MYRCYWGTQRLKYIRKRGQAKPDSKDMAEDELETLCAKAHQYSRKESDM